MAAPSVINKSRWMIYGASGYTGKLAARLPRPAGMEPPILAGRTLNNISKSLLKVLRIAPRLTETQN